MQVNWIKVMQANWNKLKQINGDDQQCQNTTMSKLQMFSSVPKNDDILKYGALFENLAFLSKYNFILEQTERKT